MKKYINSAYRFILFVLRKNKIIKYLPKGGFDFGWCPICEGKTVFIRKSGLPRNNYICAFCCSSPRQRALLKILNTHFPAWRQMKIYESSPWGALSDKLKRECTDYVSSQFYPDVITGSYKEGIRCENLEKMTFGDESFDLVIRQDVLEHVLNPALAFKEISRILKPTGVHVFTIPYYSTKKTIVRAGQTSDGIKYLKEPMFHDSQSDEKGSLVVTEWGNDVLDLIFRYSGMKTIIYDKFNSEMGLNVESLEVFIGTKI